MAKKKSSKKGTSIPVRTDVSSVEAETIKRVNQTIISIEKFLAKWESSKIRNDLLIPQIGKIKKFHTELLKWQKEAVKGKDKDSERDTLKRLHDFVIICRNYS